MDEINLQNTKDESSHHSLIIRCRRNSAGELRGHLINPITNSTFSFASTADMHHALDMALEEIPLVKDGDRQGSETKHK